MPQSRFVPVEGLDQTGIIRDVAEHLIPPNGWTDGRNIFFKNGSVNKRQGTVRAQRDIANSALVAVTGDWSNNAGRWDGATAYALNDVVTYRDNLYARLVAGTTADTPEDDTTNWGPAVRNIVYITYWPESTTPRYFLVVEDQTIDRFLFFTISERGAWNPVETTVNVPTANQGDEGNPEWQSTLFTGGYNIIINNNRNTPVYLNDGTTGYPAWVANQRYLIGDRVIYDGTVYQSLTDHVNQGTDPSGDTTNWTSANIRTALVPLSDWNNFTPDDNFAGAKVIRGIGNRLIAGNITYRSITGRNTTQRLPGTIRVSDRADTGQIPGRWGLQPGSLADEFELSNTSAVQDIVPLQGQGIIYTTDSIHSISFDGGGNANVRTLAEGYGALATGAVLEFDGRHLVVGSDDIYVFGGHPGSINSVADGKVRNFFFQDINPVQGVQDNLFLVRDKAIDEIQIFYPDRDSTGPCNKILAWNYRNNTWSINTADDVVAGFTGPVRGAGLASAVIEFDSISTANTTEDATQERQTLTFPNTDLARRTLEVQELAFEPNRNATTFDGEIVEGITIDPNLIATNESTSTWTITGRSNRGNASRNIAATGTGEANNLGDTGINLTVTPDNRTASGAGDGGNLYANIDNDAFTRTVRIRDNNGVEAARVTVRTTATNITVPAPTTIRAGTRRAGGGGRGQWGYYDLQFTLNNAQTGNVNEAFVLMPTNAGSPNRYEYRSGGRPFNRDPRPSTRVFIGGNNVYTDNRTLRTTIGTQRAGTFSTNRFTFTGYTTSNGYRLVNGQTNATINPRTGEVTFGRVTRNRVTYTINNLPPNDDGITVTVDGQRLTANNLSHQFDDTADVAARRRTAANADRAWVLSGTIPSDVLTLGGADIEDIEHELGANLSAAASAADMATAINNASDMTAAGDQVVTASAAGAVLTVVYRGVSQTNLSLTRTTNSGTIGNPGAPTVTLPIGTNSPTYQVTITGPGLPAAGVSATYRGADSALWTANTFTGQALADQLEEGIAQAFVDLANGNRTITPAGPPAQTPWERDGSQVLTHSTTDWALNVRTTLNRATAEAGAVIAGVSEAVTDHRPDSITVRDPNRNIQLSTTLRSGEHVDTINQRVLDAVNNTAGILERDRLDEWEADKPYRVGKIALYNGAIYRRLVAGTTAATPDTDTTNWVRTSQWVADVNNNNVRVTDQVGSRWLDDEGNQALWTVEYNEGLGNVASNIEYTNPTAPTTFGTEGTVRVTTTSPVDGEQRTFIVEGDDGVELARDFAAHMQTYQEIESAEVDGTNARQVNLVYTAADYVPTLEYAEQQRADGVAGYTNPDYELLTQTIRDVGGTVKSFSYTFDYPDNDNDRVTNNAANISPDDIVTGVAEWDDAETTNIVKGHPAIEQTDLTFTLNGRENTITFASGASADAMASDLTDLIREQYADLVSVIRNGRQVTVENLDPDPENELLLNIFVDNVTLQYTPESFIRPSTRFAVSPDDVQSRTDPERPWSLNEFNLGREFVVTASSKNIDAHRLGYSRGAFPSLVPIRVRPIIIQPVRVGDYVYVESTRQLFVAETEHAGAAGVTLENYETLAGLREIDEEFFTGLGYESYVERVANPLGGGFDKTFHIEKLQLLTRDGDVDVTLEMSDLPNADQTITVDRPDPDDLQDYEYNTKTFKYMEDYKIDWRVHGRVFNYRIGDTVTYMLDDEMDTVRDDIRSGVTPWRLNGFGIEISAEEERGRSRTGRS